MITTSDPPGTQAPADEYVIHFAEWRATTKLTQVQIAEALGVKQHTVSGWLHGSQPLARHLPPMARLFGCSIEELYAPPRA